MEGIPLIQWLKRTENKPAMLPSEVRSAFADELWSIVETDVKYEGYIKRQGEQVTRSKKMEDKAIPSDFRFEDLQGLRAETIQKLTAIKPETLGQAARISGITPADVALLSVWVAKNSRQNGHRESGNTCPDLGSR